MADTIARAASDFTIRCLWGGGPLEDIVAIQFATYVCTWWIFLSHPIRPTKRKCTYGDICTFQGCEKDARCDK